MVLLIQLYNLPIFFLISDIYKNTQVATGIEIYIKTRGLTVSGSRLISGDLTELSDIFTLLKYNYQTNIIFFNFLEGSAAPTVFKGMRDAGMYPPNYIVLSFFIDISITNNKEYNDYLEGNYFITSLNSNIKDTVFTTLFSDMYNYLPERTSLDAHIFTSIDLYSKALNMVKSTATNDILKTLHNNIFKTALGDTKTFPSNYVYNYYTLQTPVNTPNGLYPYSLFESQYATPPQIYPITDDYAYTCDWTVSSTRSDRGMKVDEFYTIGVMCHQTGPDKLSENFILQGVLVVALAKNDNNGLNGRYIRVKIADSNVEDYTIPVNILLSYKVDVVIGCSNDLCRKTVSSELLIHKILLYYPISYVGNECLSNVLYTGMIPNQYIDQTLSHIVQSKTTTQLPFIIIGTAGDSNSLIINEITKNYLSGLAEIEKIYEYEERASVVQMFDNLFKSYPNGAIIFVTLARSSVKEYVTYYTTLNINVNIYFTYVMTMRMEDIILYETPKLKGLHLVTSYFAKIGTENSKELNKNAMHYCGIDNVLENLETSYEAALLWTKAVELAGTANMEDVLSKSYNLVIKGGISDIPMTASHHMSKPLVILGFNGAVAVPQFTSRTPIEPQVYNWRLPETKGYICDYSDPDVMEKKKVDLVIVALIISLSGADSQMNTGINEVLEATIRETNNKGGLLKTSMIFSTYDDESSEDKAEEIAQNLYDTTKNPIPPHIIVSSVKTNSTLKIANFLTTKNALLLHVGEVEGNFCENNIIIVGTPINLYDRILDQLLYRDTNEYALIFAQKTIYSERADYIKRYMNWKGANVKDIQYIGETMNAVTANSLISSLPSRFEKGYLIYLGTTEHLLLIFSSFNSGRINKENYHFISLTTGAESVFKGAYPMEIAGSYFMGIETEGNKVFKESLYAVYDSSNPITERMESCYILLKLWMKAVELSGSYLSYNITQKLYNLEIDSPEGKIKMLTNQYTSRIMTIVDAQSPTNMKLVYSTKDAVKTRAWDSVGIEDYYICDFSVTTIGKRKKMVVIKILVPLNLKGGAEYQYADGILAAVDKLNENGGALDRIVLVNIVNYNGDIDEITTLINTTRSDDYSAIFGGVDESIYTKVGGLNKNNLWFILSPNPGELCYQNTISTYLITNQVVDMMKRVIIQYGMPIYIIYEGKQGFSTAINSQIANFISSYNLNARGSSDLDLISASSALESLKSRLGNSGIIINLIMTFEKNIEFFTALSGQNVFYPDFIVVSASVSQNIVDKVIHKNLYGHLFVSSYFHNLMDRNFNQLDIPELAEQFTWNLGKRIGWDKRIDPQIEASYSSLLLWEDAVSRANSFSIDKIKEVIYGRSLDVPSGFLLLEKSNTVKRRIYLGQILEEKQFTIIQGPTSGIASALYSVVNTNNLYHYQCDISSSGNGEQYRAPYVTVLFFHNSDLNEKNKELYTSLVEDVIIDQINSAGGILGKKIEANHYFYSISSGEMLKTSRELMNNNLIAAGFGCLNQQCVNVLSSAADRSKTLFFHLGRSDGTLCSPFTVFLGPTQKQLVDPTLDYVISNGIFAYYVVSDLTERFENTSEYIKQQIKVKKGVYAGDCFIDFDSDEIENNLLLCINSVKEAYSTYTRIGSKRSY